MAPVFLMFSLAASGQEPVRCCSDARVAGVVGDYLLLHAALLGEGDIPAGAMAYRLAGKAHSLAKRGLPGSDRKVVARLGGLLDEAKMGGASSVKEAFPEISRYITHLVLNYEGGDRVLVEAFCPGGLVWLQEDLARLRSPYSASGCAFR